MLQALPTMAPVDSIDPLRPEFAWTLTNFAGAAPVMEIRPVRNAVAKRHFAARSPDMEPAGGQIDLAATDLIQPATDLFWRQSDIMLPSVHLCRGGLHIA